jgi:hypothetical protein
MDGEPISNQRRTELSLALLIANDRLSRRAGSFLGQLIVDPTPMTEAQERWFLQLVDKAGPRIEGGTDDL